METTIHVVIVTSTLFVAACSEPNTASMESLQAEPALTAQPRVDCAEDSYDPEELKLFHKLRKRASALREREIQIEQKRAQLQKLEKRVEAKLLALRGYMENKTPEKLQTQTKLNANLTEIIRHMNARSAGEMLAEMQPAVAAQVLSDLGFNVAGKILSRLPADTAAAVAELLALR